MIGDRVIPLTEVGVRYLSVNVPNPNYSSTRAFWIQPSVERLLDAGRDFERKFLTPEELSIERGDWNGERPDPLPQPRRFKIPEFETMKALLSQGIVAAHSNVEPNNIPRSASLARWSDLKRHANEGNPGDKFSKYNELRALHPIWGLRDPSVELLQRVELPAVGPSMFQDEQEIGRPFDSTELLSEKFAIPFKAVVTSGPTWLPDGHYNPAYVFGAWDAGTIETELTTDVFKHVVYLNGKVRTEPARIKGGVFPSTDADGSDCNLGFSFGDPAPKFWQNYPHDESAKSKSKGRAFFFYTKNPIEHVATKVGKTTVGLGVDGFSSATNYFFDLNTDGTPDFLLWEGVGTSKQEIHDPGNALPHYRMAFINIAGEWWLLMVDEFLYGCGC